PERRGESPPSLTVKRGFAVGGGKEPERRGESPPSLAGKGDGGIGLDCPRIFATKRSSASKASIRNEPEPQAMSRMRGGVDGL
ncbi:MAG: hypothetical protein Q7T47_01855, partial [Anaerolineales bacterium]|nr:hypothetical protein [Anaerolineales bacterium]